MYLLELVARISQDADPALEGFQAGWAYIAANLLVPLATGLLVAAVTTLICKLIDGSSRGEAERGAEDGK